MDNENTILDSNNVPDAQENVNNTPAAGKSKVGLGERAAYAAGGAVVGAGLTAAGQAMADTAKAAKLDDADDDNAPAANTDQAQTDDEQAAVDAANQSVTVEAGGATVRVTGDAEVEVANNSSVYITGDADVEVANGSVRVTAAHNDNDNDALRYDNAADTTVHVHTASTAAEQAAPDPEEAIVATATGVRVAQVSDDMSFSQAFADARAQVGPGGVFEWHGRAYGTYYKDEWDQMTPAERAEYQASIDYNDVLSDSAEAQHHNDVAQHNAHGSNAHLPSHSSSHHSSHEDHQAQADPAYDTQNVETDDVDVRVLEVGQTDLNEDGIPENAAVLEISGRQVLIVDVDQDGTADAAFRENNGEIEGADLSGQGIPMPDQSDGDAYMAQADSAPDYMNDANVGMYEA